MSKRVSPSFGTASKLICIGLLAYSSIQIANAASVATGPSSWRDSETGKIHRAVGPGASVNYERVDGTWDRIDPRWVMSSASTWRVAKGKYQVEANASGDAKFVVTRAGIRHVLGTKTTRVIAVNLGDTSWVIVDSVGGRGGAVIANRIVYNDAIPGVNKQLIYEPDAYREHFVFSSDLIKKVQSQATQSGDILLGTATQLDLDSLGLVLSANDLPVSFEGKGTIVSGWASAMAGDSAVWHIAEAFLNSGDSSTDIRVWKWFVAIDSIPHLIEMFSMNEASRYNTTHYSHDAWFGKKTSGSSLFNIEGAVTGSPFACPTSGYADSITARLTLSGSSGSPTVGLAVYEHVAVGGGFIDSTHAVDLSLPGAAGTYWKSMELTSRPYLTAGVRYLLVAWSEAGAWTTSLRVNSASSGDTTLVYYNSFGTWPSGYAPDDNFYNYGSNIYLTYTEDWPRRRMLLIKGGNR